MGIGASAGGGSSSSSSSSTSESWLLELLKPMISGAISGVGTIPENVLAGMTDSQKEALEKLQQGQDWSGMIGGAGQLGDWATGQMGNAQNQIQQGMQDYKDIMSNLQNGGFQQMVGDMYNSDLVNTQKEQIGKDIQAGLNKGVQGLNQQASGSGNMGSSRAGVAQGVMAGEAMDAYASGAAGIESNAWNTAMQTAGQQAGQLIQGSLGGINAGNSMFGQAGNMFNNSMGWGSNIMSGQLQDTTNKWQAGSLQQQWNQAQADNDRLNQMMKDNPLLAQLQMLLPVIGGTAGWGQTTTGSGSQSGSQWGVSGQLGNSGMGGKSDARLKDEIETINEATEYNVDGVIHKLPRVVVWKWNDIAKELFESEGFSAVPPACGVIAQELEEIGLERFVVQLETNVEGLGGMVRLVNYPALIAYAKEIGAVSAD